MNAFSFLSLAAAMAVALGAAATAAGAPSADSTPRPPAGAAEQPLFPDRVLARGKGLEIKESQVTELYEAFKANRAVRGQNVPEALRPKVESDILDRLIATRLFIQRATPDDLRKAKQAGEKFLADEQSQAPSKELFDRQLMILGMKPELFRAQIMEQATIKAVIDREIKSKIAVTQQDAEKFYREHPAYFQAPEMVRVSHILFSTRDSSGRDLPDDQMHAKEKLANAVLARARKGEGFSKLVDEYSDDVAAKSRHGEYTFARAKDDPQRAAVPQVEGAAFSLQKGQISDVILTPYGYHIIKLLEKIPPRAIPFAEAQDKIKQNLIDDEAQRRLPAFINQMRAEAGVKIVAQPD